MKHLNLAAISLSILLLSGCGGGGSSDGAGSTAESETTQQLKQKDAIIIVHNTKASACSLMGDAVRGEGVSNVTTDSPANTVSCATYGKVRSDINDENGECAETTLADFSDSSDISLLEDTNTACVIGANNN